MSDLGKSVAFLTTGGQKYARQNRGSDLRGLASVEIHTRYRTETYRFSTRGVLKNGLWYCGDARLIGFIPSVLSIPELAPPSSPGPTGIPDFPLPGQEE